MPSQIPSYKNKKVKGGKGIHSTQVQEDPESRIELWISYRTILLLFNQCKLLKIHQSSSFVNHLQLLRPCLAIVLKPNPGSFFGLPLLCVCLSELESGSVVVASCDEFMKKIDSCNSQSSIPCFRFSFIELSGFEFAITFSVLIEFR